MDRYSISNDSAKSGSTVETKIGETTQADSYDIISVFSIYFKSDDTGRAEDSSLFVQTLSKLQNVRTHQRALSDDDRLFSVGVEVERAASQSGNRKLFILHYAGHAIAGSTPESLTITPKINQEPGSGPELNLTVIKDELNITASKSSGLDVLLVIDCCCAFTTASTGTAVGQGKKVRSAKVELMAASTPEDGRTFTQDWCQAFTTLLEIGKAFTCDDIVKHITTDSEPDQLPCTFVLREGSDLPITFWRNPDAVDSTLPAAETSRTGTLLLLRMPEILQQLLTIPNTVLVRTDS